jgi:fructan beta-fructosidase
MLIQLTARTLSSRFRYSRSRGKSGALKSAGRGRRRAGGRLFRCGLPLILAFVGCAASLQAADDILIEDFEGSAFEGWEVTGDAFGEGPATRTGKTTYQITGFRGNGLASSYRGRSLEPKGRLVSPEFTIQRDYINLLLGGGPSKRASGVRVLVDGEEVVQVSAVKGYRLNETSIPVKSHRGKTARIEIYDNESGYWGVVLVDHITQSNTKIGYEPVTMEMEITDRLLIFPIAEEGTARRIQIDVEGMRVHDLTACLAMAEDEVAWWGYLDMSDMIGKTATLTLQEKIGGNLREMIACSPEPRFLLPRYEEKYRPQLRFSQLNGWNNDPNGMVYYEGRYHLFWQCNPLGTGWGNMYWGHASSPDLIHWTEHKRALRSGGGKGLPLEKRHPSMATGACFSGSGHVDITNATGMNEGDSKTLLLFNSDMNAGISIFTSRDGINFSRWMEKYPLGVPGRDGKFVYHEPSEHWVAVSVVANKEHGRHFPIQVSKDLKSWRQTQIFEDVHECPEFFELPVLDAKGNSTGQGPTRKRWVLMEASSEYFVGGFDGERFVPDHPEKQVTMIPRACYAGQCFSNTPDGRVIYIGWAGLVTSGMPFNQGFTLPLNLTLREIEKGRVHLYANPVKELEALRQAPEIELERSDLESATPGFRHELKGELYEVAMTLEKKGDPRTAEIRIGEYTLTYNFDEERFGKLPAPMTDGKVELRIFVDRPVFEVFLAGGYAYHLHSRKQHSGQKPGELVIQATGPAGSGVTIERLIAYPMRSIWKESP